MSTTYEELVKWINRPTNPTISQAEVLAELEGQKIWVQYKYSGLNVITKRRSSEILEVSGIMTDKISIRITSYLHLYSEKRGVLTISFRDILRVELYENRPTRDPAKDKKEVTVTKKASS